ncbi:hypothetical protein BGZ83_010214 [Gryganskiella cystojenkinii]|nr:hypothetical protein BGZ83_010214 [Gryganskiella cystojenkinii]
MEPLIRATTGIIRHQHHYGIQRWAAILTTVPKSHRCSIQQHNLLQSCQRRHASGTTHERAANRIKMAPRVTYQPTSASTWIISDGSVSADKEAIALAKGLALPWVVKRVQWRQGFQWLPIPFKKLIMDYWHVVNKKKSDKRPWFLTGDSLKAPYPNFVIGSGAGTLPGILHVSRMSGKASYSAHIHFPALPFVHFDQVFLQRHEIVVQLAGLGLMKDQKNYFRILSSLNTITPKSLEQARSYAQEHELIPKTFFDKRSGQSLSSPTVVTVLIGGPNGDCSHNTERMVNRLSRLVEVQNCRLLISYSQRTAETTKRAIQRRLVDGLQGKSKNADDKIFIYDPMASVKSEEQTTTINWESMPGPKGQLGFTKERNPYEAMLALADKIVVSADSITMTNEALATGKPVYILGGELTRGKLKVFHRYLADQKKTRAFRPGRIPILPLEETGSDMIENDTADPLSYPGDHAAWDNQTLKGQGPEESKRVAERLKILRESRITGRRAPDYVADATC